MRGLLLEIFTPIPGDEAACLAWISGRLTATAQEPLSRLWMDPGDGTLAATCEFDDLDQIGESRPAPGWAETPRECCLAVRRWQCRQLKPGDARPSVGAVALRVICRDAPAGHDAEFNSWYDTEHLTLIARVPGVLAARRFVAENAMPKYVALYDLADPAAREHPAWHAAQGTPWSRRIDALGQDPGWVFRTFLAVGA